MSPEAPVTLLSVLLPLGFGLLLPVGRDAPVKRVLLSAFGAGAAVAAVTWGILMLRGAFTSGSRFSLDGAAVNSFLGAALPEETLKVLCLAAVLGLARRVGISLSLLQGALAGLALGLGFAMVENLVYAIQDDAQTGMVRLLTAVPCHACLGVVMGHYLVGFFESKRWSLAFKAWVVPLIAHGLYNMPLVLDPRALPASAAFGDLALSCLVLAWLVAWTRQLVSPTWRGSASA